MKNFLIGQKNMEFLQEKINLSQYFLHGYVNSWIFLFYVVDTIGQ